MDGYVYDVTNSIHHCQGQFCSFPMSHQNPWGQTQSFVHSRIPTHSPGTLAFGADCPENLGHAFQGHAIWERKKCHWWLSFVRPMYLLCVRIIRKYELNHKLHHPLFNTSIGPHTQNKFRLTYSWLRRAISLDWSRWLSNGCNLANKTVPWGQY